MKTRCSTFFWIDLNSTDWIIAVANAMWNGAEIDLVCILPSAIIVADFKSYGGKLTGTENGPWQADGVIVKGGRKANPFYQPKIWLVQTAGGSDTLQIVGTCRYLPTKRYISASTDLRLDRLGRGRQARLLVGLNVGLPVEHAPAELQKLGADPCAAPAFQGGLTDTPANSQLFLIEMSDFHLGLLPHELAGVHEGAVRPTSQGNSKKRRYSGRSFSS